MSTGFVSATLGGDIDNYFVAPYTGSGTTTLNLQDNGVALQYATYSGGPQNVASGYLRNGTDISTILEKKTTSAGSGVTFTYTGPYSGVPDGTNTFGTYYTFVVPVGVTSISILCIGGTSGINTINSKINNSYGNSSWVTNQFLASNPTPSLTTATGTTLLIMAGGGFSPTGGGTAIQGPGGNEAPFTATTYARFLTYISTTISYPTSTMPVLYVGLAGGDGGGNQTNSSGGGAGGYSGAGGTGAGIPGGPSAGAGGAGADGPGFSEVRVVLVVER